MAEQPALNSPQYHRDRAEDLAAGNTGGLSEKEAARMIYMHKMAAQAIEEEGQAPEGARDGDHSLGRSRP